MTDGNQQEQETRREDRFAGERKRSVFDSPSSVSTIQGKGNKGTREDFVLERRVFYLLELPIRSIIRLIIDALII